MLEEQEQHKSGTSLEADMDDLYNDGDSYTHYI